MKRILSFFFLILLTSIFFASNVYADSGLTCASQNGHCVFSGTCANGSPINAGDCTALGFKCCPNTGVSSTKQWCNPKIGPFEIPIGTKLNTAIGCIDLLSSNEAFLGSILGWAVGIGGGIAFLLIIYSGFMIMTASGNPERLQAGRELLTSAISGLILLVFSIFLLRLIGVDILGLNKFGFAK